jgi:hypothetical protein
MSVQVNFGDLGGWGLDLLAYLSAQIGAADGAAGARRLLGAAEAAVCGRAYARAMAAAG